MPNWLWIFWYVTQSDSRRSSRMPDYSLFAGLPGAVPHLVPRLLVAFGEDPQRFQRAEELQKYAGIAPVTERSGKKSWVHWRWQCPRFFVRPSSNVPAKRSINRSGLALTTTSDAPREVPTKPPCAPWP